MQPVTLSLTARTLYAELLELALGIGVAEPVRGLRGSLVAKQVRGGRYLYYQYRDLDGRVRQAYLGPDRDETRERFERLRQRAAEVADDRAQLDALRAAYLAAGGLAVDHAPLRVLAAFADAGLLRPGPGAAVLIGTHAFNTLGGLLGVRWRSQMQTQDIDLAGPTDIALALPPDLPPAADVLARLDMGFLPVPALDPRAPSTSYRVRGRDLRVDLLTPLVGKATSGPRMVPSLGAPAHPLRFLDYLIEEPVPAVVCGKRDAVLLNVPSPERFALHKLLLSAARPSGMAMKAQKDRQQALQLLAVLLDEAPDGLAAAHADLMARGDGWRRKFQHGLEQGQRTAPAVVERLERLVTSR